MSLSVLDIAFIFISDVGWACEWVLVAVACIRHERCGDPHRWKCAALEVVVGTIIVISVMKVASFDADDPTSLRPASRKTDCGVIDFGSAPSSGPVAGYPSGHAYMSTLATVLLISSAYFRGTPWSWPGMAIVLNGLTLIARRELMCHTMLQIVDGVFLGLLVGTCAAATMHAPPPRSVCDTTLVFQESWIHPPISSGA